MFYNVLWYLLLQPADVMQFPVVLQLLQAPEFVKTDIMCQKILINKHA